MSQYSLNIRQLFAKGTNARNEGLSTPENLIRYDDIVYGDDPVLQSLDVYRPKSAEGKKLPVIVCVHGGGWVFGTKDDNQFYCMDLALHGFAVVNFSYRLAPEATFPAPLEDTNLVVHWVLEHAEEYGFDTEHVFCTGDSAGAHLLGLYCDICTNPDYAAKYDFQPPKGFVPKAVALNCGAYVIEVGEGAEEMTSNLMADFLPEHGTEEELHLVNVVAHITEAFPPALIMTCTGDFLKPQAPILAAKLAEVEVPHLSRFYGDKDHVLGHVFHKNIKTEAARACNAAECAFFREFL